MTDETTINAWIDTIRRARLGRTAKLVALMMATWADKNGASVHPGIARLAVSCNLTYNVVQTALAELRNAGFIRVVARATGRHQADEYRLVIAADPAKPVDVWSRERMAEEIESMLSARRGKHRQAPTAVGRASVPHPTKQGAAAPHETGSAPSDLHPISSSPAPHGVGPLHPTPLPPIHQYPPTTSTSEERGALAPVLRHPSAEFAIITDSRVPAVEINAGTITGQWIDHCRTHHLEIPRDLVPRYAKGIKAALEDGIDPNLIKRALALMLEQGQVSWPSSLPAYIVRVQETPKPTRKLTPGEESAQRLIAGADNPGEVIDAVARFFERGAS